MRHVSLVMSVPSEGSGRAPEDALGVRASGDEAHDRTAHDMLASSGLAARKAATGAPEADAAAATPTETVTES